MEDYINVSPTSGTGNRTVSVTANPNPKFSSRSTTLTVKSGGGWQSRAVTATQLGMPFMIQMGVVNNVVPTGTSNYPQCGWKPDTYNNSGPDGSPVAKGVFYAMRQNLNESEITVEFLLLIHKDLLVGDEDGPYEPVLNAVLGANSGKIVWEDSNPFSKDNVDQGDYAQYSFSFGSSMIEDADYFTANIGVGRGVDIFTYLYNYELAKY